MTFVLWQRATGNVKMAKVVSFVSIKGVIVDKGLGDLPFINVQTKKSVVVINFRHDCVVIDPRGEKIDLLDLKIGQSVKVKYYNADTMDLATYVTILKEAP